MAATDLNSRIAKTQEHTT